MLRLPMLALMGLLAVAAARAQTPDALMYKNPQCGCCENYASYLRQNGLDVEVKATNDLAQISADAGVPSEYEGCHTMLIEGYVVDGHVPIKAIEKLLKEKPTIAGITLPGMPMGSPGMGDDPTKSFTVYAVTKDGAKPTVYSYE